MNSSHVAKVEEVSEPDFTDHDDSTAIPTSNINSCLFIYFFLK